MSFDVQGKTALVTGANRGIGKAIVVSLMNHRVAKLYAAVRDLDSAGPLVEEYGDKIVPVQIDVANPESIIAAAKTANDADLVISNAGVLKTADPLAADAIEALDFEININVKGLIRMAQAFAPVLKANGGGAFVQMNSVASLISFADFATYSASKAASYSITQALRDKLAEQGTVVLSVHPGPIDTEMAHDAGLGDMVDSAETVSEGIVSALKAGEFHLFPDKFARDVWSGYQSFATNVIEKTPED